MEHYAETDRPRMPLRPMPMRKPRRPEPLGDLRFRTLLGADQWACLPPSVRHRFSKRLGDGRTIIYTGEIVECRMSRAGWLLAQAARLIGGPLPTSRDVFVPTTVAVTEDEAMGGQFWTRVYGRRSGFPQVVHSSKRFAGPTGLEEYIGLGVGIALTIDVKNEVLHFRSDHYFLKLFGRRLRIPCGLLAGNLTVSHIDCDQGWFAFVLDLAHPLFGTLIRQTALFRERAAEE